MHPRLLGALGLAACTLLAGCSDQDASTPAEPRPEFSHIGSPSCDLNFNSLIAQYFVPPRQGVVQSLAQQMATDYAADKKAEVQAGGFGILANVEAAANLGESSNAAVGSTLVNRVLECMFTTTELGVSLPITFTEELTLGGLGAFGVRGGSAQFDTAGAVLARDGFSATAPASGLTWSASVSERILIYGSRSSATVVSYTWDKIPAGAAFTDPGIVVALCSANSISLLLEDGTFVPFVSPDYIVGFCPSQSSALDTKRERSGWGVFSVASRLASLFRPSPAHAAMVFSHGSTAGRTGYSHFTLGDLQSVTLEFVQEAVNPVANVVCCTAGTVKVKAYKTGDPTTTIPGVTVTLVTAHTTNKGKNALVTGTVETTDASGIATFDELTFLKSGVYKQEATGVVDDPESEGVDRAGIAFVTDVSAAFTVSGR